MEKRELATPFDQKEPKPELPELLAPQVDMLMALEQARQQGIDSGYVDVATGVGKTYATAHDVKNVLSENPEGRVLYLCHRKDILKQASKTFAEVLESKSHGRMFGGEFENQEQIVFATFQTMNRKLGGGKAYEGFSPEEFDYIVVDESHHGPARTYKDVIDYFKPKFKLGLTATPERRDKQDIEEIFGNKLYEYNLPTAIAEGVLTPPDYRLNLEQTEVIERAKDIEEITLEEIDRQLSDVGINLEAQERIAEMIRKTLGEHPDPRTVIYCPNIRYAEEFSQLIPGAIALHSGVTDEERDRLLSEFKKGNIPTLTVVDLLNEGIDVPEINNLVFLRGTDSKAIFLQQLGRGLRNAPDKDKVTVLDFAISWARIKLIADLQKEVLKIYNEKNKQPDGYVDDSKNPNENQPFSFSFSTEAIDAINILETIGLRTNFQSERELAHEEADQLVKEMLGLDELPDQYISMTEWDKFAHRIVGGDESAKEALIMRRLRTAMIYAKSSLESQPEGSSLTLEDHFQYYIENMQTALNRYGQNEGPIGSKLRVSLGWLAIQQRQIIPNEGFIIRPPVAVYEATQKLAQEKERLEVELGRDATHQELSDFIGIDREELKKLQKIEDRHKYGYESLSKEHQDTATPTPEEESPFLKIVEVLIKEALEESLRHLKPIERRVLEMRYGLGDNESLNREEVAKKFNVTGKYIRQIESGALKKLQTMYEAQKLREVA